ncbi:MAG: hypothetical protein IK142_01750 [Clostridiales bacterium]|nr:hypothetical protein [Clostridiales bacterium]
MDSGFIVLEGIVIFILIAYALVSIVPPLILDIIWIKRVKSGKSKKFGPLGIVSIIVTASGLMNLPLLFTMIGEYFGWI